MIVASLLCVAILVLADLLRTNRVLIEESLERTKELQYGPAKPQVVDAAQEDAALNGESANSAE